VILVCATLLPPGKKGELESLPLSKASAAEAFLSILAGQHSGRAGTWIQSLGMIADHPLKGVGIGNWDAEFLRYAGPTLAQDGGLFGRPHNDYLWVVTELGLPGLILFLWILGGGLWLVWRLLSESKDREELILLTALGAGIIAISVHAFFSFPRERMSATVIPFLLLGWIAALDARSLAQDSPRPRRTWRPALLLALSLIALVPTIQVARSYRAYFWADAYRTFDRYEESLNAINAAIGFGVVDYRFYELKALIHHKMNNPQAALEASERLLEYHPYNPWSFHKVGLFQLELENFEAARVAFLEAVRYAPGVGRIRRDLGQAYEGLGFADSALASYETALKVISSDALLRTKLASLLADQGAFDQAQEHIAAAANRLKLTTVDRDIAVVGDVAMKAQAYDAAIAAYGRAAILVPDNADYQDKLAGALEKGESRIQAVVVLKKLLDLVGDDEQEGILRRIAQLEAPPEGDG
jgi:tetratricopeptide (TPR) repeat protein